MTTRHDLEIKALRDEGVFLRRVVVEVCGALREAEKEADVLRLACAAAGEELRELQDMRRDKSILRVAAIYTVVLVAVIVAAALWAVA